ncbi:hypothetical protein NMY22_g1402 [Coprinellus aureogranulatus]|nr:hypothetical protein NMY22_g1402 [Coprinellus aureogranulatus]
MGSAFSRPRIDKSVTSNADTEAQTLKLYPHSGKATGTGDTQLQSPVPQKEKTTKGLVAATKFRADAKIWQLYLEEAEDEAADKAKVWETGLDTLLIFGGLFAGVVSTFVVDAKSGLQPDEQPRLLSDILNFLRNPSSPGSQTTGIPSSIYWVNGLWILSLFTTIFSAIMGVLAKAWLAKYTPAKNRGQSHDAYRRYKLDKQSERWLFREALILIPLIVQVATFLFLAGLVVQALGDNVTIGRTLLCFCAAGGLFYFCMTIIPLFELSSPFNTTLSELIHALHTRHSSKQDRSQMKTTLDEGLGEILYEKLILSGKAPLIDGAISEVARPGFDPEWIKVLCRTETPKIVVARLRECAKPENTREAGKNLEALEHHLLAFLSFVDIYDQAHTVGANTHHHLYWQLHEAFRESLRSPFRQWDHFPTSLRPLAFALRTNILSLLSYCPISCTEGLRMDFHPTELSDRPWEMAHQDIPSTHRRHFLLGTCRGLMQDEASMPIVRTISVFILCTRIAKAALTVSNTGRSRWANESQRGDTYKLAEKYVTKLFEVTVGGWENMVDDAMRDLLSVEVRVEAGETTRPRATVQVNLFESLGQPNQRTRVHSIKMLKHILCSPGQSPQDAGPKPSHFIVVGFADQYLKVIAQIAVSGGDEDVRDESLDLLNALLNLPLGVGETPLAMNTLQGKIEVALTEAIQSGLSAYEDRLLSSSIQFVEKLSESTSETRLDSVITSVIPKLIEMGLDDTSSQRASRLAVALLRKISLDERFTTTVKKGVRHYRSRQISGKHTKSRSTFLEALQDIFHANKFPQGDDRLPLESSIWDSPSTWVVEVIGAMYQALLQVATSEELVLDRTAAQKVLALVARDDRFNRLKPVIVKELRALRKEKSWWVRVNAVTVLELFALQISVPFTDDLVQEVLLLALKDHDENVRERALKAIIELLKERDKTGRFAPTVRDLIVNDSPDNIIPTETLDRIKALWIPFLVSIGKYVSFPKAIPFFIERALLAPVGGDINNTLLEFFKSDKFVEGTSCSYFAHPTVAHIASHPEYLVAFEKLVHQSHTPLRATLPGENQLRRRNWIKILLELLPTDQASPNGIHGIAVEALANVKEDPWSLVTFHSASRGQLLSFEVFPSPRIAVVFGESFPERPLPLG